MAPSAPALDAIRRRPVAGPDSFLSLAPHDDKSADADLSIWNRLRNWLVSTPSSLQNDIKSIRNVLVIGLHGWAVLGGRFFSWSPSEVSTGMAQALAAAIRQRLKNEGSNCELTLTLIPLFGHGMVDARLEDVLVEQLPAHEQSFAEADAVFIASHSQGAVLAGLLMDTLVERGWVSLRRHRYVGLLFMAGPHHGPFPHLPHDRFAATAELFSLGHPFAHVAERAQHAVGRLLRHGVRIVAIGADRDAVVPLFSSVMHSLGHHRRLLRGLYVEKRSRVDTFPVRLISLCLAWANTRSEPSDLLPHLSGFYRGAFFDRNGSHSTIHTEPAVYDLAALWFLPPDRDDDNDAEIAPLEHTSAHWAVHLNDAFYYSDLNAYFVRSRLAWLLARAGSDPAFEVDQLRSSFAVWSPRNKPMNHLRTIIEPLFVNGEEQQQNGIVSKL